MSTRHSLRSAMTALVIVGVMAGASTVAHAAVDLRITELRFSNETPREGDPVTLTAVIENVGGDNLSQNYDVDVWFFEGDPDSGALQIMAKNTLAGARPGTPQHIRAKFRPRSGKFDIHAIVNPDPTISKVAETTRENNMMKRTLVVAPIEFPRSTPDQRKAAVDRAVKWLLNHQGDLVVKSPIDGKLNPFIVPRDVETLVSLAGLPVTKKPSPAWNPHDGPAATSLVVTTLLATGLKPDHPAIGQGIEFLLGEDWNGFDAYDLSVVILALSATGQREKYLERVQFAVNRLLDKQLRTEEGAPQRDDGGWGYGAIADGAHMHYAIYALYTAKLWGAEIEQIGWDKAKGWVRSTQHTRGGWNYNMVESPWAEGPYGSMTATGLMALKMMGIPVTSDDFQKGMQWVIDHYTLTSNPGSFHWHYYYLLAMQRAMDTPPKQEFLGEHDWYQQMADVFVAQQYPDGRWEESDGETFASTCFGILFLTRYVPQAFAPDVSVVPEAIQLTPSTPAEGAPLSARFTLTNFGLPLANPIIEVAVYDGKSTDANLLATTEVLFSEGRSDANATVTWKAPRQGKHEITFVADPKKKIVSELDRANNAASVSLTVASAGATAQERSPLTELSPNVYAIGFGDKAAILDRNKSEVRIPGVVRPGSNVIEYLAVGPLGKVHETILTLEPEPVHIQTALLGLGVAPENNLRVQGDARTPSGAPMELWVSWERAGKTERHRAEELIWYASERRPLETTNWVFTGSRFQGPQFMADATKSLIAAYRDPDAILNHPLASGGEDGAYRANLALLPAKGTPVTLTVTPAHVP